MTKACAKPGLERWRAFGYEIAHSRREAFPSLNEILGAIFFLENRMGTKHPQAEWEYEGAEAGGRVLDRNDRRLIIYTPARSAFNENDISNARLIAAAPGLYDCCLFLVEAMEEFMGITPEWSDARIYDEAPSYGFVNAYFCARGSLAKVTGDDC